MFQISPGGHYSNYTCELRGTQIQELKVHELYLSTQWLYLKITQIVYGILLFSKTIGTSPPLGQVPYIIMLGVSDDLNAPSTSSL